MRNFLVLLFIAPFFSFQAFSSEKEITVKSFSKVIISPHIQVNFIESNEEKVVIEQIGVSMDKMNVEVVGKTLKLYLDDAKFVTKTLKEKGTNYNMTKPIYPKTTVRATVYYKNIIDLSLRGEETFICKSSLNQAKLSLKIYGESQVYLKKIAIEKLQVQIYGESFLKIDEGSTENQTFKCYGETVIDASQISNKNTKLTTYGEGSYNVRVSDNLKLISFGEAEIAYEGDPQVSKRLVLGESTIQKK